LGIEMHATRRNTVGCTGEARCNFGCPHRAKMSVDQSYLPRALAAAASVWSDVHVDRIETRGERAVGVTGRVFEGRVSAPTRRGHARRVVVAAGGMCSPVLLSRSGIRGPNLGRHMTLHPSFRLLARFDEPVRGWDGALQSAYVDHWHDITNVGLFVPPALLPALLP